MCSCSPTAGSSPAWRRSSHAGRFVFAAYAPEVAAAYQALLDRPVRLFPAPIAAVRPLRDRAQAAVPTIAFLGRLGSSAGF